MREFGVQKIRHPLTTSYHIQSNGKAESSVTEAKRFLQKVASTDINPELILLEHRNIATGVLGLTLYSVCLIAACRHKYLQSFSYCNQRFSMMEV